MAQLDLRRIFIVHECNSSGRDAMVVFLRLPKLDSLTFDEIPNTLKGSPFVGNIGMV